MKIFFCTDLHGYKKKYEKVLEIQNQFDLIIVGSDILPKDGHYHQEKFIREYLPDFFLRVKKNLIIDFGNDDHASFYNMFKEEIKNHNNKYYEHIFISHFNEIVIDDLSIIGMHYVPDYPFGLKDWCRLDNNRIDPIQYGTPCTSTKDGYKNINNLIQYYEERPTIRQCLNILPKPSKEKCIYLFHAPPRTLGLDVCHDKREVGSHDITNFIDEKQPLICFSGHIHESPDVSNLFWNKIGKTFCIQPGQTFLTNRLTYCLIDSNDIENTMTRKII